MADARTADGRYYFVEQADGNVVVYDTQHEPWRPVWDRWSYEAATFPPPPIPDTPPVPPPTPQPPPVPPPPPGGGEGGFVEHATSTTARPLMRAAEMAAFVPRSRGAFQFPAPYRTRGFRVSDARDGLIRPVGYSYWPNASMLDGHIVLAFCGSQEGALLRFVVHLDTGAVEALGPLPGFVTTGEGCYFNPDAPTKIYGFSSSMLWQLDFFSGERMLVFDTHEFNVWQASSNDSGSVHACTLRDANWQDVGIGVVTLQKSAPPSLRQFPLPAAYDECQIDRSGRYLLVKDGNDNTIVDLQQDSRYRLLNQDGAVGHSDMGFGFVCGEDDMHEPGALVRFNLGNPQRELLYHLTQWESGLGHVAVRGDRILVSNAHRNASPRVNELVLVHRDGSLNCTVVCPNLMDLNTGGGSEYEKQVKANIDPTGQFACWTANCGTDRLDLFLVQLP